MVLRWRLGERGVLVVCHLIHRLNVLTPDEDLLRSKRCEYWIKSLGAAATVWLFLPCTFALSDARALSATFNTPKTLILDGLKECMHACVHEIVLGRMRSHRVVKSHQSRTAVMCFAVELHNVLCVSVTHFQWRVPSVDATGIPVIVDRLTRNTKKNTQLSSTTAKRTKRKWVKRLLLWRTEELSVCRFYLCRVKDRFWHMQVADKQKNFASPCKAHRAVCVNVRTS